MKPRNKAGRTCDAARPIDNEALILVQKLRQVNSIAPLWSKQAWGMFDKWGQTKNPKYLGFFAVQVEAILTRLNCNLKAVS